MCPCRADARDRLRRDYLSKEDYNFEAVNRASKACGPLVKWAIAQVSVRSNRFSFLQFLVCCITEPLPSPPLHTGFG